MSNFETALLQSIAPGSRRGATIIRQEAKSIVAAIKADGKVTQEEINSLKSVLQQKDTFELTSAAERQLKKLIEQGVTIPAPTPQRPV